MSNFMHVYTLLHSACRMLDDSNDHAIAAYVGLAMALMEDKYGIKADDPVPADRSPQNGSAKKPPPDGHLENGGSWA